MKVADTNRPPKYTLTYFKLSYGNLQTVTLQTLEKPQNRKKQNFQEDLTSLVNQK